MASKDVMLRSKNFGLLKFALPNSYKLVRRCDSICFTFSCNVTSSCPQLLRESLQALGKPKSSAIVATFTRVKSATHETDDSRHTVSPTFISNELYGSDTMFWFAILKRYLEALNRNFSFPWLSSELQFVQDESQAKIKLALIFRSNAPGNVFDSSGSLVQVYACPDDKKRVKKRFPRSIPYYDPHFDVATVSTANCRITPVVIKDVLVALY